MKNIAIITLIVVVALLSYKLYAPSKPSVKVPSVVTVPTSISDIFTAINKNLNTSVVPIAENKFYSYQGNINKNSWKLDLITVVNDKSQHNTLRNILINQFGLQNTNEFGTESIIEEFSNNKTVCYYINNKSITNYVTCAEI